MEDTSDILMSLVQWVLKSYMERSQQIIQQGHIWCPAASVLQHTQCTPSSNTINTVREYLQHLCRLLTEFL